MPVSGHPSLSGLVADRGAQKICRLLTGAGHRVLFVGGAVRDVLLGLPPGDIDLATDATPDRVMALAAGADLRALPTGFDHGTVTVLVAGRSYEVTTFRRDVRTFGRRALVSFAANESDDARRRDFTINALYATPDGGLVDPLGSLADLRARRLRFVGDPAERIAEDFLRILRFFRFQASFAPGRKPDARAFRAAAAARGGLSRLSRERVGQEMRKLLALPRPAKALQAMERGGILDQVLPGAHAKSMPHLMALERRFRLAPDWMRRLAALAGSDPLPDLRLSRREARDLTQIRLALESSLRPAALAAEFGESAARDALLIRAARSGGAPPRGFLSALRRGQAARFPLRARDLDGLVPGGPALGLALRDLRALWLDQDLRPTRSQLLKTLGPQS